MLRKTLNLVYENLLLTLGVPVLSFLLIFFKFTRDLPNSPGIVHVGNRLPGPTQKGHRAWEYFPSSSLAGCQAILTLEMLGFSYCYTECQDLIQMQLKIQTKL